MNAGYQTYQSNSVLTSSGEKLTLMLYNGAIKFSNQAKEAIKSGNISESHRLLVRTQAIIEQLQVSLDDKYPISESLNKMYDFVSYQLVEANVHKDPAMVDIALDFLREMRDTWEEAMKLAKKQ